MDEGIGEECGVWGVYLKGKNPDKRKLPELLYLGGSQLQHRGQLSAGEGVYDPIDGVGEKLKVRKKIGLVNDLYKTQDESDNLEFLVEMSGIAGIGHVRYSTSGTAKTRADHFNQAQPFLRDHGRGNKNFIISFNGNLTNYDELKEELFSEGYNLKTDVDTEVIMHLISKSLNHYSALDSNGKYVKPNLFDVYRHVMEKLDGAYNILTMSSDGDLVCFRDPQGFKPLVYGENEHIIAFASESVALRIIGIHDYTDVTPGSCMVYNGEKLEQKVLVEGRRGACHFERVYFARPDSIIDGESVFSSRFKLGQRLAESEPLKDQIFANKDDYVVVPVPATAIPAAIGYAETLGLKYREALYKNGGSLRGFINKEKARGRIMFGKYGIIEELLEGKKVIVIDDSIVRGETSKRNIHLLRNVGVKLKHKGAREIHFRVTEPPLRFPCFYGIDFPSRGELIANQVDPLRMNEEIAALIDADSFHSQSEEGLISSCGTRDTLCLACTNGDYLTEGGKKCYAASLKK